MRTPGLRICGFKQSWCWRYVSLCRLTSHYPTFLCVTNKRHYAFFCIPRVRYSLFAVKTLDSTEIYFLDVLQSIFNRYSDAF